MWPRNTKRRLTITLVTAFAIAISIACFAIWRGISDSLRAENTLPAHRLVLDLLEVYVKDNGKWPENWDALLTTVPAQEPNLWKWPYDLNEIRNRVRVDFSLRIDEVAAMDVDSFDAVQQVGPHYDVN
jgi:hypothetical protein